MPKDRLYLAMVLILLATSIASSLAAFHFYQVWSERPPPPKGSLTDDGNWNPFSNSQFWDPWSSLSRVFSSNYTLPGQV